MKNFTYVTPSEIIEYNYCPRFTYYLNVLDISQNEEKRFLVNKGREIHHKKAVLNKQYLRSKIGSKDKFINVYMTSNDLHLAGLVDEVHFLNNDQATVIDYKFAFYEGKVYNSIKYQQVCYGLLVEEKFDKKVDKAYVVYIRSRDKIIEIPITDTMRKKCIELIQEVLKILNLNYFPTKTPYHKRCEDCCYLNLCDT